MSLPSPHKLLRTYQLSPKKSFGQNFLADENLTRKIAEEACPLPGTIVLELGAGLGALTQQLLLRGAQVIAVERDRELVPVLQQEFADAIAEGRLHVVEADAKTLDWDDTVARFGGGPASGWVVAGNLPYQITGPLIEKAVHTARSLTRAVFLVQKEVAERLVAQPRSKEYGVLTIFTQAQFRVRKAFSIGRGAFVPVPRVDSAVVVFEPHPEPLAEETPEFRKVVKGAFSARRKTLRNAWRGILPPDDLAQLAACCAVDLDLRGEALSVPDFARVARSLAVREGHGG